MARRRYKGDQYSAAAGTRPDEPAPAAQHPPGSEPTAPQSPAQDQAEAKPDVSSLRAQIDQMRSYAQPDPLDQYISHYFQGALPNERQWLRANQHHLQNPMLIHTAAQIALQRGVPRQSPEFLQFIGQLLDQHHAAMQAHTAPAPPPAPPPMSEPAHAAHVDIETEHSDSGQPDEERHMAAHVSAPVSRGDHGHAIEPEPTMGSIRLSAEERDMAHRSMPHLSADEAEKVYAANVLKRDKMKRSGLIK